MSVAATVLASETHHLTATGSGRQYRIDVALPLGYGSGPGAGWPFEAALERWPAIYVLDGNWYFGMVTDMIRPMSWCGGISDAIVVGIGYPVAADPAQAFRESFTRRTLDLTPARDEAEERAMAERFDRPVPTGGADSFHRFIREDLIPFIEKNYRADPARRSLIGHSYGGLFAAYSLFAAAESFQTYVIGSPTLSYGGRCLFRQEGAYAEDHDDLSAGIFVYAGDEEFVDDTTLTDTIRLATLLQSRNYKSLRLVKRLFPDHDHCAVAGPGFHAGLKFALSPR